ITHDLAIVRKMANRVAVMKDGEIVETGETETVFAQPRHEYTKRLLAAQPRGAPARPAEGAPEVMTANGLKVWFPIRKGVLRRTVDHIRAVDGIDIRTREGQTVGVVGESGSGKTTLGLALLRLISSEGPIRFRGKDVQGLGSAALRPL